MIQITIRLLHLILFSFIILGPISNNQRILKYHSDIIIFLLVKWFILNKCTLTKIEKKLRNLERQEDGIVYQFLEPIITLNKHPCRWLIYGAVAMLGLISYSKLN